MAPDPDLQSIAASWNPLHAVWAGLFALLTFFSRRAVKQIDDQIGTQRGQLEGHDDRLKDLEKTVVSRSELMAYMEQMRLERRDMHKDNTASIHKLRDSMDQVRSDLLDMSRGQR